MFKSAFLAVLTYGKGCRPFRTDYGTDRSGKDALTACLRTDVSWMRTCCFDRFWPDSPENGTKTAPFPQNTGNRSRSRMFLADMLSGRGRFCHNEAILGGRSCGASGDLRAVSAGMAQLLLDISGFIGVGGCRNSLSLYFLDEVPYGP